MTDLLYNPMPQEDVRLPPSAETMRETARLRAENERLRALIGNEMNVTTLIAHALADGHIAPEVEPLFEEALVEMIAAIKSAMKAHPNE